MKEHLSTIILAVSLGLVSILSLFIGVIDVRPVALLTGDTEVLEVFLISRLPRLLAILCTGIGMSVAGLIMQQLCMNKFISPTTGATISSAQFGILLALLFMPNSTLWGRWDLHLWQRFSGRGYLSGLSSGFSLRMWRWCHWSVLCSEMCGGVSQIIWLINMR